MRMVQAYAAGRVSAIGIGDPCVRDETRLGVNVRVWRHDLRTGETRLHDEGHNLVTAAGLNLIRDRLRGVSLVDPLSHFAVGTNNTATASGDTTLGVEVFRDVFTQVSLGTASLVIRYYLGPNDANGFTLREAGLFNGSAGGTLYARRVLSSAIVKTIDLAATFEWTLSFAAV
jgi:hypothetical protein